MDSVDPRHREKLAKVISKYLQQQTRKKVNNDPSQYLAQMLDHVSDYSTFIQLFNYWTIATRPTLSPEFISETLKEFEDNKSDPDKLASIVHRLHRNNQTLQGGAKKKKKKKKKTLKKKKKKQTHVSTKSKAEATYVKQSVYAVVLDKAHTSMVLYQTNDSKVDIPHAPSEPEKSNYLIALQTMQKRLNFNPKSFWPQTLLGEYLTRDRHIFYFEYVKELPNTIRSSTSWFKSKPSSYSNANLWTEIMTHIPTKYRFNIDKKPLTPPDWALIQTSNIQDPEINKILKATRNTALFYIQDRTQSNYKQIQSPNHPHPLQEVPPSLKLRTLIQQYHVRSIFVDSNTTSDEIQYIRTNFPKVRLFKGTSLLSAKTQAFDNPALTSKKQGSMGFNSWLLKTYSKEIAQLKSIKFECATKDGLKQMYPHQASAVFFAGPRCPAIQNFLVTVMTGGGKTLIMQALLGEYNLKTDMPKLVFVPSEQLRNNFYKDLLSSNTSLTTFVKKIKGSSPTVEAVIKLLGFLSSGKVYRLVPYKQYLDAKKADPTTRSPFGSQPWSPKSPLRCMSWSELFRVFRVPENLDTFAKQLQQGETCVPVSVSALNSANILKPPYRYKQDGNPDWESDAMIKNPFDYKIIVIDEMHELFENIDDPLSKMVQLMLKYAKGSRIIGLTATPVLESDTSKSALLDVLKGSNAALKNSEGYISYMHEYVYPLFPATIPKLFTKFNASIPILGRIVFSPLFGPNKQKYEEKIALKDMKRLQAYLNSAYLDRTAMKTHRKVTSSFEAFEAHSNKMGCLYSLLQKHPGEKTLILAQGGIRTMEAYWSQHHPMEMLKHENVFSKKIPRIGFLYAAKSNIDKVNKQNQIIKQFVDPRNNQGEYIRTLCVDMNTYGTGVDFKGGVRRIIIANAPENYNTFMQNVGRTMRSCAYTHLPLNEQTVHVDIMVATTNTHPHLNDYSGSEPSSTWTVDELFLYNLFQSYAAETKKMQTLFANHAVDRSWLQNIKSRSHPKSDQAVVVYCNGANTIPLETYGEDDAENDEQEEEVKATTIKHVSNIESISTLYLPIPNRNDPKEIRNWLSPNATIDSRTESTKDVLQHIDLNPALACFVDKQVGQVDNEYIRSIIHRANIRWTELSKKVTLESIDAIDFWQIPSIQAVVIFYQAYPPLPIEFLNENHGDLRRAFGVQTTKPAKGFWNKVTNWFSSLTSKSPPKTFAPNLTTKIQIESRTHSTLYIQMYFPDIYFYSISRELEFKDYRNNPTLIQQILAKLKRIPMHFFAPHNQDILIEQTKSNEVFIQVKNIPKEWLDRNRDRLDDLIDMFTNLGELGLGNGWTFMMYNGKIQINEKPVILAATGHIEPRDILAVANGNVYLSEVQGKNRIQILKAPQQLPNQVDIRSFQEYWEYRQAQNAGQKFVFLKSTQPWQIVPTDAFASIREFASRSSTYLWFELWRFVNQVQAEEGTKLYVSTDPIPKRAYFSLNISRFPLDLKTSYETSRSSNSATNDTIPNSSSTTSTQSSSQKTSGEALRQTIDRTLNNANSSLSEKILANSSTTVSRPTYTAPTIPGTQDNFGNPVQKTIKENDRLVFAYIYTQSTPGSMRNMIIVQKTNVDPSLPSHWIPEKLVSQKEGVQKLLDQLLTPGFQIDKYQWIDTKEENPAVLVWLRPQIIKSESPDPDIRQLFFYSANNITDIYNRLDDKSAQQMKKHIESIERGFSQKFS